MDEKIKSIKDTIINMTVEQCALLYASLAEELQQKGVDLSSLSFGQSPKNEMKEEEEEKPRNLVLTKAPEDIQSRFPIIKLLTKILNVSVLEAKKKLDVLPVIVKENATNDDLKEIKQEFSNNGITNVELSLS